MRVKRLRLERGLLRCPGLYSLQQGVVGEVRIPLRGLIAGMTQHLADCEQIDAGIDHEGRRRVRQIMQPQARQIRFLDRVLPTMLDRHEGWRVSGFGTSHGQPLKRGSVSIIAKAGVDSGM